MRPLLLGILLVLAQDDGKDAATRLKRDGWSAARDLAAQGAAARADLEVAARSSDQDVAFCARAALRELDGQAPARTKGLQGPARTAVAALFRMVGESVNDEGLPEQTLQIPDGLTFSEAVEWAGTRLNVDFVRGETAWTPSARRAGPRFAFGRFRAGLDTVRRTTEFSLDRAETTTLRYSGVLRADPNLRLVPTHHPVRLIEAIDDTGARLTHGAAGIEGRLWLGGDPAERTHPFSITLAGVGSKAVRITVLRLALRVAIAAKQAAFTFDKILEARGARNSQGPVTAVIKTVATDGDTTTIDLVITATADVEFPDWSTIRLMDADGGLHAVSGSSMISGRTGTYRLDFRRAGKAGPGATLTFSMTTETESREVLLEFRDLPLR